MDGKFLNRKKRKEKKKIKLGGKQQERGKDKFKENGSTLAEKNKCYI